MKRLIPSPLHGWRAFWGEVGIIVLGVLIALGAQRFVDDLNERAHAREALAAIRAEVADHDFAASELQIAMPCLNAQFDAVIDRLKRGDTAPLPQYSNTLTSGKFVVRFPHRIWANSAWQGVNNDDVLRRQKPAIADELAIYYAQVGQMRPSIDTTLAIAGRLNSLARLMPKGEGDRLRYIEAVEELRSHFYTQSLSAGQMRDALTKLEFLIPDARLQRQLRDESGTLNFCRARGIPLGPLPKPDPTRK